ncbi:MAG: hypothetical protein ACUVQF_09865 [Fervidobacterium sp.]|uniref:hypothetical protein n=1 Tax=Fervidobacterium sp. TaxID=1871331 RepID=UPI00404AB87A
MVLSASKRTNDTVVISLLYFLYRVIFDTTYIIWIHPIYGYGGFPLRIDNYKILISYIVLFILIMIIPKTSNKVSYMILQLHFLIMVVPFMTVYAFGGYSTTFFLMFVICFILEIAALRIQSSRKLCLKTVKIRISKPLQLLAFIIYSTVVYFYLYKTQGFHFQVIDLGQIYDIRSQINISIDLMKYLITWQFRIINPYLLVISFVRKNYKLLLTASVLQVLMYFMYPHKEIFLSVALLLFSVYVARKKMKFDLSFATLLSSLTILNALIYEGTGNLIPFALVPTRMLFVPAENKFLHYEFFKYHEKLYYSEGLIGKVLGLRYPYDVPSGYLIGGNSNANVGYLAYAYDNAGFVGMILISLLFVILLLVIDLISEKKDKGLIFSLLVYPMIILNDGDLFTLLLTGGLFLLILMLLFSKELVVDKDVKQAKSISSFKKLNNLIAR